MSAAAWVAWTVVVLAIGACIRPRPVRRPTPSAASPARVPSAPPTLLVACGGGLHHLWRSAGRWVGRDVPRCTDPQILARTAVAIGAVLLAVVLAPPVALLLVLGLVARTRVSSRRRVTAQLAAVRRELPDAVELLAIAISSGANLTQAIGITVASLDGCVAAALRDSLAATQHGVRMIDALRILPDRLGPAAQPLVTALVLAERHGTPLVQALRQLAVELRDQRRRHAEETARRVPIRLLAPLVLLLLPAFALLTVAPLLAGGLRSLRL